MNFETFFDSFIIYKTCRNHISVALQALKRESDEEIRYKQSDVFVVNVFKNFEFSRGLIFTIR